MIFFIKHLIRYALLIKKNLYIQKEVKIQELSSHAAAIK